MILRPSSQFRIVWQISDPLDATTYYPQAVIKNSYTGATLDTLNLEADGDGRYSKLWRVIEDTSSIGLQIDITVTVYTDSGHTVKSPNHYVENRVYEIEANRNFGGGGVGINYLEIRKIIKQEIEKIIFPTIPKVDEEMLHLKIDTGFENLSNRVSRVEGQNNKNTKEFLEKLNGLNVIDDIRNQTDGIVAEIQTRDEYFESLKEILQQEIEQIRILYEKIVEMDTNTNELFGDVKSVSKAIEKLQEKDTNKKRKALEVQNKVRNFVSEMAETIEVEEPEENPIEKYKIMAKKLI